MPISFWQVSDWNGLDSFLSSLFSHPFPTKNMLNVHLERLKLSGPLRLVLLFLVCGVLSQVKL